MLVNAQQTQVPPNQGDRAVQDEKERAEDVDYHFQPTTNPSFFK